MTATVSSLTASNATAAAFRLWAKAVSDAIVASGMVITTDTGQIDFTTVPVPSVASTASGYNIFKFNDAAQATAPVFLKVEYGSSGTTSYPQVWITVGTATDGAGTITSAGTLPGTVTTRRTIQPSSSSDTAGGTGPLYCNGDGSAVALHLFGQVSGSTTWGGGGFLLERARDPDGTATARGVTLWCWSSGQNSSQSVATRSIIHNAAVTQPANITSGYTLYGSGLPTSAVEGSTVYPAPVFTGVTPRVNAPSRFLTLAGPTDVPLGTQYPMTHYGTSGTWVSCGPGPSGAPQGYGNWAGLAGVLNSPQIKVA